jgi:hypothetical protein
MSDKCFLCRGSSEQVDNIPLCHLCYEKCADPDSSFYNPALIKSFE